MAKGSVLYLVCYIRLIDPRDASVHPTSTPSLHRAFWWLTLVLFCIFAAVFACRFLLWRHEALLLFDVPVQASLFMVFRDGMCCCCCYFDSGSNCRCFRHIAAR